MENTARHRIRLMHRRWIVSSLALNFLICLVLSGIFFAATRYHIHSPTLWAIGLFIVLLIGVMLLNTSWKLTETDLVKSLNSRFPELEESATLLLAPAETLAQLQYIQQQKTEERFVSLPDPAFHLRNIKRSGFILLAGVSLIVLLHWLPSAFPGSKPGPVKNSFPISETPGLVRIQLQSLQVRISPPAYTGKTIRNQEAFDIKAEQGALVNWVVRTSAAPGKVQLVINDKDTIRFKPTANMNTEWQASKTINQAGFYQLLIDKESTELFKIEVIKDLPPTINIVSPAQHTIIDYGQPARFSLKALIQDDYGLSSASISATVAKGKGEGVKFSDQQIAVPNFQNGMSRLDLEQVIDLAKLGMAPGDELYYYINARDNFNQEYRTDVQIITIPDTAELMSMDGMTTGVNLVPEYFRSQRQIIIDTEKLLKDKDTISTESFKNRSNNLGIDQKLLRLRYGKFLGEESEGEIVDTHINDDDHDHDNDHADEAPSTPFGDASDLMKDYGHSHDNAEDATFFEPELKSQLKATLNEMWKSELQLRTYKPQDALPFEYKALRLLKDLQQKSRVYVAKTGFNATPLKPENRLSGELDKIINPVTKAESVRKEDPFLASRTALSYLQEFQNGRNLDENQMMVLQKANEELSQQAAKSPAAYLEGAKAFRRILLAAKQQKQVTLTDINTATNALRTMLDAPGPQPTKSPGTTGNLSDSYFEQLKKGLR